EGPYAVAVRHLIETLRLYRQLEPPMTIRTLEYALRPRSIAIIGASVHAVSVGEKLTENILSGGFAGPVYLVNSKHRRIAGQDAYLSIDELPEAPDLAVIA